MPEIRLTVPTAAMPRIVHALCKSAGLDETPANAKKSIIEHIRRTVRNVEMQEAEQALIAQLVETDTEGMVT